MQNLFECKVKYEKIDEATGKQKTVTEKYLIDAVSFTEAEARIYTEMELMISGEFIIVAITRANYTDIFNDDKGGIYYRAKVSFITIDENSGREKKTTNSILVVADNVADADIKLKQGLDGIVVPFEISSISDSKIMDLFLYESE